MTVRRTGSAGTFTAILLWVICTTLGVATDAAFAAPSVTAAACTDDAGLRLPAGFCATVFADHTGHARHLAVSPDGVVYVNTWSGNYYDDAAPPKGGFLLALKDTHGTGKADVIERFGDSIANGGTGGTGIRLFNGWLYAETNDKIVRYRLGGKLVPRTAAQTIVSGLPLTGDHPMHPFLIDATGALYVDVATATNSCQAKNRMPESPGNQPCVELETRGGIWRFDANKRGQVFGPAQRYATGIRNAEGIALDDTGHRLFVTQHGRDQLHANWPALYPDEQEATLPAEELLLLTKGGDYGWPQCYYDARQRRLVLAPEYGGDGGRKIGGCGGKSGPVAAYPAHWAPNDMVYYDKQAFPTRYRGGVFIAFHGSWDRAPYQQQGYNLVFQSLDGDKAGAACEIFADGFAGRVASPATAEHRPSGVAVGPDGALYVADDVTGRIYRIVYRGGEGDARTTACPDPAAGAGPVSAIAAKPPEGSNPDAGVKLPVPAGATAAMVELGNRLFHGEVRGAACTGCHGADGAGTTLGPNLADQEWLWSDGSVAGITATITQGVAQPKHFRAPMPPLGGAKLTSDEVAALSAYVWGLSHRP